MPRDINGDRIGADVRVAAGLADEGPAGCGSLESPLALTGAQRDITDRAGSTAAGAAIALQALAGSFLQATGPPLGRPGWTFRHPTLWDGFASWVSTQSHLLTVVLAGITDSALLTRVDCQDENADQEHGTLLGVPPALYRAVAERLAALRQQTLTTERFRRGGSVTLHSSVYLQYLDRQRALFLFLARRTSDAFLRAYLDVDPQLPGSLVNFTSFVYAVPEPAVLARLGQAGLLDERVRRQAVERMADLAVTTPDDGWLETEDWEVLLTPADRAMLMDKVGPETVHQLPARATSRNLAKHLR